MAMTNAERQRRYRERARSGNHQLTRISVMVSATTKEQLEGLANFYGESQRYILEVLIREGEERAIAIYQEEYEQTTSTVTQ